MQPEQLLFARSFFGTLICILMARGNLKYILYDSVPPNQGKNIFLRCFQASLINIIELTIVKYISLIFQSIARNLTPIATVVMSYFMTGEKISNSEIVFIVISLAGVTCTTVGFSLNDHQNTNIDKKVDEKQLEFVTLIATLATFSVPFISAWGNITTSQMKNLHENTISCYINPSMGLFMLTVMFFKGEISSSLSLFSTQLTWLDWLLLFLCGLGAVVFQTFRYMALQYDEPGKLSQYIYLSALYQLLFDIFIFKRQFIKLQWVGFGIIFICYGVKFGQMLTKKRKEQTK